ncbi:MAG: glycoside hydrolase family 57 protein [Candidatus Aminicenantales bacterium]
MYVSILWHFHQPIYRKPGTKEYLLPWVNFHCLKNYYQMARLIKETEFPCTLNFVPCLLEQIEDYAQEKAIDPWQHALEKKPEELTPRDIEILRKFVPGITAPSQIQFGALRSWFSPLVDSAHNPEELLSLQKEILKNLISDYHNLWREGKIELMTSPYYHPLLPLLFDLASAREEKLPSLSFRHPEDGREQLIKGREYFKQIFGDAPSGLWPPEGGLSPEVARDVFQAGFSFAVTDENILWKSLGRTVRPEERYIPYRSENLSVFFRDRDLSNRISFEYKKWDEKEAVNDFLNQVEEKRRLGGPTSILVIALDGENPWGHYRDNGVPFLREFFSRLKKKGDIQLTFFQDYLAQHEPQREVTLVPGTWMEGFSKWIGSPAKNRAWEALARARDLCGAREEIYIAESSDWFWWFGEENAEEFGTLFESYIQEACRSSGVNFS